jgi:2-oxoglutarate ferredoxin oxidoreductase subunit alpha
MALSFIEGNEAVALGAMAAGCRFFAGYPITPATTIYNAMLKYLPPEGGVCLQGEDEIASIGYCLGASMAGHKVLTATSGPGISLYSEQISFAIGSEIPIVIVNVQRLGPSTGSATKGADGDVQFMRWGSSSGLPVIVLAPVDAADCYRLTVHAFNLAEQYRCPVFVASNKEIAMTRESVDLDAILLPAIIDRKAANREKPFLPFVTEGDDIAPDFLPLGDSTLVRQTSSTHGINGYITVDPDEINAFQQRLEKKLTAHVDDFTFFDQDLDPQADTLLVAYGVTARAARVAVAASRNAGRPVSLLTPKTLWPVPERLIVDMAAPYDRVVVVEMNTGQYVREIRRLLPGKTIDFYGQMNGNLLKPEQIREVIA